MKYKVNVLGVIPSFYFGFYLVALIGGINCEQDIFRGLVLGDGFAR
jgi:hypothetical protein